MISSQKEIERMRAMLPPQHEIDAALANHQSIKHAIPPREVITAAINKFKQIQKQYPNLLEQISDTRRWLINSYAYEDIYKPTYDLLYEDIDNEKYHLELSEDNSLEIEIEVVDSNDNSPVYSLYNQKDVAGLPKLFVSITNSEAINFISFLSKYPYLAHKNEVGKKIFQEIQNIPASSIIELENETLYRGRPWLDDQEIDYTVSEMWEPPYGRNNMGRFNPIGINYLYMADTTEIAVLETNTNDKTVMKVQVKKPIYVLDISLENCPIFELCNKMKSGSNTNPKEYLLPNYIAQCCSLLENNGSVNIGGIKYKSSLSENGFCYVFFNKHSDSFLGEKIIEV